MNPWLPLPVDWQHHTDEELGRWLVAAWVGFQADKAGIPRDAIPPGWAEKLIDASAGMDSDSVGNSPLESAFRKTCKGDMATAGRMLRGIMMRSAHGIVIEKRAQRDAKRQAGTQKERRPDITKWIDEQLARDPNAKSPDLWCEAPDWLTDQIGQRRFATRVTARRKSARK